MDIFAPSIVNVNTFRYGGAMDEKRNRQDWLDAGLAALAAEGQDGLRIMAIAQKLAVTKGSFYWHFKNLEAYQGALLAEWEQRHTRQAIAGVENSGGEPKLKLHNLLMAAAEVDFKLGRAVRAWSLTSPEVQEMQARVDQQRVDYLVQLLLGIGWPTEEAVTLARWAYAAIIGLGALEGPPITSRQCLLLVDILSPGKTTVNFTGISSTGYT